MSKDLTIVVAASGDKKDVTIEPGTTASDILKQTGLQGYVLSKDGDSSTFFAPKQNVYPEVEDGQKLWATTDPKVGELGGLGPPSSCLEGADDEDNCETNSSSKRQGRDKTAASYR